MEEWGREKGYFEISAHHSSATILIMYMYMNNHVYSTLHAGKKKEGRKEDVDQRKEH